MSADTLGTRLRKALADRGMSMAELSKRSGIPYSSVQNYAAGKQLPGADALARIHNEVGVSLDWLITGKGGQFRFGAELKPRKFELEDYFELKKQFSDFDGVFQFRDFWSVPDSTGKKAEYAAQRERQWLAFMLENYPKMLEPIVQGRSIDELSAEEASRLFDAMQAAWTDAFEGKR